MHVRMSLHMPDAPCKDPGTPGELLQPLGTASWMKRTNWVHYMLDLPPTMRQWTFCPPSLLSLLFVYVLPGYSFVGLNFPI